MLPGNNIVKDAGHSILQFFFHQAIWTSLSFMDNHKSKFKVFFFLFVYLFREMNCTSMYRI